MCGELRSIITQYLANSISSWSWSWLLLQLKLQLYCVLVVRDQHTA